MAITDTARTTVSRVMAIVESARSPIIQCARPQEPVCTPRDRKLHAMQAARPKPPREGTPVSSISRSATPAPTTSLTEPKNSDRQGLDRQVIPPRRSTSVEKILASKTVENR